MTRAAIVQSSYIPWKGFFDLIHMVDVFILYDDAQYTRRDWRNRNIIKTPQGPHWLTIPVKVKGKYTQAIKDTEIADHRWADRHWKSIQQHYARAPYFDAYRDPIRALYDRARQETRLSSVNYIFLAGICALLGIQTELRWSMEFELAKGKTERLVHLCQDVGAQHYLSGPSARAYLEEDLFREAGIGVSYMDYSGYPEYAQLHGSFLHEVSIIDLILNTGPDATRYLKSFARN